MRYVSTIALLAVAFTSGCGYGTGANVIVNTGAGGQTTSGAGGQTTSGAGGQTTTGAGGQTTSGAGGQTTSGAGGQTTSGAGGQTTSGAGGQTTTGAGGAAGTTSTTPGWGTPVAGGPTGAGVTATVTVNPNDTVGTIGPGFAGFSFEKTHITNGSLTSTNASLIALFKLLGSPVMRIGANDVDVSNWTGTGAAPAQPSGQPFTHNITTGGVDQLCGFLAATGGKVIYAVNFKTNNVSASAAEAAYVQGKCGSSIYGFEIGNEIDKYGSWANQQMQWESFATAIVATPGALLIGPAATGGSVSSFSVPFAAAESAKFGSKLVLLTQHYYVGASGSSAAAAVTLQTPKSDIASTAVTMNGAAVKNKIPDGYRIGECNTFSGHGQMGVSDTLVAGLWSIDYMFVNAENGASGVNFHGGELGMDGNKDFYYEPIKESGGVVMMVQPEYYGMLLFSLAGQGPVVSTTVTSTNPTFTAYAVKASGFTSVVLDNKSATSGVNATINLGTAVNSASAIYLQGSPAGSLSVMAPGVTLAGAEVTAAGVWNRNPPFIQGTSGNTASVYVPPASAALVRLQ